jgi:serine/threonine-protein kinase
MFFNQAIDSAAVDAQSGAIITALANRGGWGNGNRFQVDFSIDVYYSSPSSLTVPFVDAGMYAPDSDVPATVRVPPSGTSGFESSTGTACDGGDCHYLVVDTAQEKLFEGYSVSYENGSVSSDGSVAVWDFNKSYPANLRGDVCTSADAGGLPIAPMLFSADEVDAGEIKHAIRFILPNNRIQCRTYVRPATHGTGPSSCTGWAPTDGVPYGARFRLRADYPVSSLPTEGARVVARALQKYGMILADGGNIALTAQSDSSSAAKWSSLMSSTDLRALQVTDFEMIAGGARFNFASYDCVRTP